jgi:hypothetical protein
MKAKKMLKGGTVKAVISTSSPKKEDSPTTRRALVEFADSRCRQQPAPPGQ